MLAKVIDGVVKHTSSHKVGGGTWLPLTVRYEGSIDHATQVWGIPSYTVYEDRVEGISVARDIEPEQLVACKLEKAAQLYNQYFYSDVEMEFPNGKAFVQFRDETDRTNLANVAQGAQSLVLAGQPDHILLYRTKDNVNQEVPASMMVNIALSVLNAKQAILSNLWAHKDALRALCTPDDDGNYDVVAIKAYDVTAGW
jgi:hypothetical protein